MHFMNDQLHFVVYFYLMRLIFTRYTRVLMFMLSDCHVQLISSRPLVNGRCVFANVSYLTFLGRVEDKTNHKIITGKHIFKINLSLR